MKIKWREFLPFQTFVAAILKHFMANLGWKHIRAVLFTFYILKFLIKFCILISDI